MKVAGFTCRIELMTDGSWRVTIASVSVSRRRELPAALVDASGGLIDSTAATTIAAALSQSRA
jgi:hypothetical protein